MNRASSSARERWQQIIARQQRSGLSVIEFCRRERLAASSLFAWKRRLAGEGRATAAPAFVQLTSASAISNATDPSGGAIELHLSSGRRLLLRPGFDPQTLAAVLRVLEAQRSEPEDC